MILIKALTSLLQQSHVLEIIQQPLIFYSTAVCFKCLRIVFQQACLEYTRMVFRQRIMQTLPF